MLLELKPRPSITLLSGLAREDDQAESARDVVGVEEGVMILSLILGMPPTGELEDVETQTEERV